MSESECIEHDWVIYPGGGMYEDDVCQVNPCQRCGETEIIKHHSVLEHLQHCTCERCGSTYDPNK